MRLLCRCGSRGGVDGAVVGDDDSDGLDMMTMVVAGGVEVRWLSCDWWGCEGGVDDVDGGVRWRWEWRDDGDVGGRSDGIAFLECEEDIRVPIVTQSVKLDYTYDLLVGFGEIIFSIGLHSFVEQLTFIDDIK
ncbi:hypothetical protein Tco_1085551 [Tanacetum coccineum]